MFDSSCILESRTKQGQKSIYSSFKLNRSILLILILLNFPLAVRSYLLSLYLFLVCTALEIANSYKDKVITLDHLYMVSSKMVLKTDKIVLILFSALLF